jgi:2-keto-4-pentenoate hydratase
MNLDFPVRARPYTEADAGAGIEGLFPVLEIGDTGTCTGHLFAAPGDTVRADFGSFGVVQARFGAVPTDTAQAGIADPGR